MATSRAVDAKRLPPYSARRGRIELVTVPPQRFLAVDGTGDPEASPRYEDALRTLYPVAYALKRLGRATLGRDHVVPPLEGLWWADDLTVFTSTADRASWRWTLLLLVPGWFDDDHVETAREAVRARRGTALVDGLRVERLDEGLSAQVLHVGPYREEGPLLRELHERFLPEHGLVPTGHHHEVYLGDPRRCAPERLRTILRQPVRRRS